MKILITEEQFKIIVSIQENKQLADKIYFNTGKLNENDKRIIYSITNGDNTTKIISDIYFTHNSDWDFREKLKKFPWIHKQLLNYDPNIFPIKDFNMFNVNVQEGLYHILEYRGRIIENLRKLPNQAFRNLKGEIRKPRDQHEFYYLNEDLDYFMGQYSLLGNRDPKFLTKIHNKMFKSNTTIKDLLNFAEDKENLLGGVEFTKDNVIDMINNESDDDMSIVFDDNNIMVLKIESANAIKKIGCNSFWCFTYGENNYKNWNDYSYNGLVYVIIDFSVPSDDPEFMYTLIKPLKSPSFYQKEENDDEIPLYNMSNENYYNPYSILNNLVGKNNIKKLFTFDF